jgi:formate-dependent nitrite reductase cytochrome c552 subunit
MKIPKIPENIPKVPLIIGAIFALSLLIVVVTTIALKKTELQFKVTRLEGKFTDRAGAIFVGSETCKRCHERTYLEWRTSLHSRMMRDARTDPATNIGDFESPSEVRTFTKEDIAYTLGSQWKQQYLKKEGDDLIVLPAQYNVFLGEWQGYFSDEPDKRIWFIECAGCHATGVDPEKKTFIEMGVACEACHGPGSNHVEAVPGFEIPTIIQASRLTPALAAQICGSCHTGGRDKTGKYAYPVAYQIHKGEGNIRLYFEEVSPGNHSERFWPSGESRHSNQQYLDWKQSEHAKVGVTCITCHDVHRSKSALQAVGEVPNPLVVIRSKTRLFEDQLCKTCHTTPQYRSVHRIHTFGSCIRCHMPKVTNIGEAGDAHSHTFRFMFPQFTLKAGGFDKQPNACNACHHHKETSTEALAGFLEAAKRNDMPKPFAVHEWSPGPPSLPLTGAVAK